MILRQETERDHRAVHALHTAAFDRDAEAQLVAALRTSEQFIPALSIVAVDAGCVAGHILFSVIRIRDGGAEVPALGLAPLAVQPASQNRGIGSALVRHGLQTCRQFGHRIVVVVGHPRYYPRFGFGPARARGLEAPFPVGDDAFMVCEIEKGALEGVHAMLEYPPAFALV
jgi:putative acetyltransferase